MQLISKSEINHRDLLLLFINSLFTLLCLNDSLRNVDVHENDDACDYEYFEVNDAAGKLIIKPFHHQRFLRTIVNTSHHHRAMGSQFEMLLKILCRVF